MLLIVGDPARAEASLLDAIRLAERQGAKLFQLRASSSLARLWRDQGRHKEAGEFLVPIFKCFPQGSEALDLIDSKALLTDVGSPMAGRRAPSSSRDSVL